MAQAPGNTSFHVGRVVWFSFVLGLLHFGQDFLKPLAIAGVLSLVISPLVRKLARAGLGRIASTLISVFLVAACVVWMGAVLAIQLVAVGGDLPQYRSAIVAKMASVQEIAVAPFERFEAQLRGPAPVVETPEAAPRSRSRRQPAAAAPVETPPVVQVQPPARSAGDMLSKLLSGLWGPVGDAGIVLVLLVFILLERESLGDRFIRLAGESKLGTTVQALTDAAQGVSRFFLSQATVNIAFGVVVGASLWVLGVPHAALWAVISALLRFVPYVGVLGAAGLIGVFSAAVDPGWSLTLTALGVFLVLELLVAHVVEPQVYGHSTGLAPLAVIVSALFWAALWGPVGLLLSTPLTLCLVVIGRHVQTLAPLTVLLSESPGLNAGQRFYQRCLAASSDAIQQDARAYLKRNSLAKYCDNVLLPGIGLAAADYRQGLISQGQRERIQRNMLSLVSAITRSRPERRSGRRRAPVSLVNASVGAHLRQLRQERLGQWQGRLDVPAQSIVLCVGFETERDDLLSELLVVALREGEVDARSVSLAEPQDPAMADKSDLVGTVFFVFPQAEQLASWLENVARFRAALPQAILATVYLRLDDTAAAEEAVAGHVDLVLHSYAEAEAFVLQHAKTA